MRLTKTIRAFVAGVSILAVAACAAPGGPSGEPRTVAQRSSSDQKVGDQNHPKIVEQFGGEIPDAKVKRYVRDIGLKLAKQSEQPNAKWTFTVLDSPVVNAFALPGGYVYVTRGLMALANDEAELAGVIGHEIGHVTAAHGAQRQRSATLAQGGLIGLNILGAVFGVAPDVMRAANQVGATAATGLLASYSRSQEFESDKLGVRYLARSGYDPEGAADFLSNLQAESTLQARIAGGAYNPNRVDFFASHPATAQRVREAIKAAGVANVANGAPRNRDRYLKMIDGMIYGDSAEQGFVDGRKFSHPVLRFEFTVPQGFTIQNSSAQVTAAGPDGSRIIFSGDGYKGGSMDAYIARTWAPAIAKNARTGRLDNLRRQTINGLAAASATLPVQAQNGVVILRMTAIRKGDTVYRFLGVQPQGANETGRRMDAAAASFRNLSAAQARRLKPKRIDIYKVRRGDSVSKLAGRMPFDGFKEDRFRVLNGLEDRETLKAGQVVKLVTR